MKYYFYFVCVAFTIIAYYLTSTNAHYTHQWAVHISGGAQVANEVARDHGFINHGLIFENHYFFTHNGISKRSVNPNMEKRVKLAADTRVQWASQQKAKRRVKRDLQLEDSDPWWENMWYLNRGSGLDMNVIPAWMDGITGKGAVVTILDDGLEKDHPDLVKNYDPMASYDVNNHDSDPSPRYDMIDSNRHGTRCAGEVAATSNNSICALGVAHGAQVGGVRMLDGDVTDVVEARSLSLNPQHIDIYSASWGPDDDGKTVDGPGELATRAFIEGIMKGRNGKGSIFVWASGNGGRDHDNCNCDGYTNSIYSLSISSATEHGNVPWYSEACSSTLATTYSSGAANERQVVTTDLRHSCTKSHTGTSASAPLAAGICALALEANPNLTWRDMQHIVVRTARPQHLTSVDWQVNGVGRNVSHSFGYGLMDAYAMVNLAKNWITVPEQHKCEISAPDAIKSIPAKSVVVLTLAVTECEGVEILEHVQAKLTIYAQRRGDLNIQLTSPMGTRVTLLAHRAHDNSRAGFNYWPFMSVHSWGEYPNGTWQLEIHNDGRLMGRATLQKWSMILYGSKKFMPIDVMGKNKNKNRGFRKSKSKQKAKNQRLLNSNKKSSKNSLNINSKRTETTNFANVLERNSNDSNSYLKSRPHNSFNQLNFTTSNFSPYFYAISNTKKFDQESMVKHYLKFVKNVTITYPIMIPTREDSEKKGFKKLQKMKEKSRDINFNRKSFIPKASEKPSKAEIKQWDLTLYGTATAPGFDLKYQVGSKDATSKMYSQDVDNSIKNSNTWKYGAENRKDTLEVEEKLKGTASSSCKTPNANFCLECSSDYLLHNGTCVKECPAGFYDNREIANSKDTNYRRSGKCLQCHYTCKSCLGPLDYQCTMCFSDAVIYIVSKSQTYCYTSHIISEVLSEKWYYRVIFVLPIGFFVCLVLFIFYRKKYLGYKRLNSTELEDTDNLGAHYTDFK
ncbi:furin-like protease 1, isoforms 1/1-X/2 isoform X1 [Anthonomus grandis grandis]|uniref:furin-like protease 1, isoforms 1/1-X/2 isoform X1 n=1 Tax=Anthonomus grandis grandis TaxID=2921223 RepID=UPI002165620A|nr:furin-like protease 1, isoforms 1/1-X/2 isoform X1 [Anthonomus grandis grandis]